MKKIEPIIELTDEIIETIELADEEGDKIEFELVEKEFLIVVLQELKKDWRRENEKDINCR